MKFHLCFVEAAGGDIQIVGYAVSAVCCHYYNVGHRLRLRFDFCFFILLQFQTINAELQFFFLSHTSISAF